MSDSWRFGLTRSVRSSEPRAVTTAVSLFAIPTDSRSIILELYLAIACRPVSTKSNTKVVFFASAGSTSTAASTAMDHKQSVKGRAIMYNTPISTTHESVKRAEMSCIDRRVRYDRSSSFESQEWLSCGLTGLPRAYESHIVIRRYVRIRVVRAINLVPRPTIRDRGHGVLADHLSVAAVESSASQDLPRRDCNHKQSVSTTTPIYIHISQATADVV